MNAKTLLAAIGFSLLLLLFAFSLWAEWGPYAWVAAAQVAMFDSYGEKLTFMLTLILFIIPVIALSIPLFNAGRRAWQVALALPALALLAHLGLTGYYMAVGDPGPVLTTTADAIAAAKLLPRSVLLDHAQLAQLDTEHATGISSSANSWDDVFYVPFAPPTWRDAASPVVLVSKQGDLDALASGGPVEGSVRLGPLPYLVRRDWDTGATAMAVIITNKESVREYWLPPTIGYVLLFLFLGWLYWKSRREA